MDDFELLPAYVNRRSRDAFAELLSRCVNLVYSAALRQTRALQLAEEVT